MVDLVTLEIVAALNFKVKKNELKYMVATLEIVATWIVKGNEIKLIGSDFVISSDFKS